MSITTTGANLENIKEANISAVLGKIYANDGISRIDVAKEEGISCALVTKILSKLVSCNVVSEAKCLSAERGRPKVSLHFNSDKYAIAGLRINKKYLSSILCTAGGKILCHNYLPITDDMNCYNIYEKCCVLLWKSIGCSDDRKILGIGIAAPGPLPKEHNRITALESGPFNGFCEVDFKKSIENDFNLPVVMWHDAHCGAFNEYVFGDNDSKYDNIVFIATDSGLGAGIIIDGKPYSGGGGLAGEVAQMLIYKDEDGNVCKVGHMASQALLMKKCGVDSIDKVIELVNNDEINACNAFDEYITNLSVVIANFITTVSPEAVIISDKIAQLSERVYKVCDVFLKNNLPDAYYKSTKLIISPYGKHSVLRGACGALLHQALEKPCDFFNL